MSCETEPVPSSACRHPCVTQTDRAVRIGCGEPPYAALWKSSMWRIQLVSGFHLGTIWATNLSNSLRRKIVTKPKHGQIRINCVHGKEIKPEF